LEDWGDEKEKKLLRRTPEGMGDREGKLECQWRVGGIWKGPKKLGILRKKERIFRGGAHLRITSLRKIPFEKYTVEQTRNLVRSNSSGQLTPEAKREKLGVLFF